MPLKRLERTRESLPAGYRFGDAQPVVRCTITTINERVWALCRCGQEFHDQASINTHVCDGNVIEGDHADVEGVPV